MKTSGDMVVAKRTKKGLSAGEKTRLRILDAAEEVFARFGYEGARMDQIAERAGVEKANIYYYFEGKEDLYRALTDRVLFELLNEVRNLLGRITTGDPWDKLDAFLDVFFRIVENHRGVITLAFGELLHPPKDQDSPTFSPLLSQVEAIGMELLEEGMRAGRFRKQDAGHALITLEGALFYYFLLPDDRIEPLVGGAKYDAKVLEQRKQALRGHIRALLER